MRNILQISFSAFATLLLTLFFINCSGPINSNFNPKFNEDGYLITDSTSKEFEMKTPSNIKFYVEVSGSMNGFFRANVPTYFKEDFWRIINYYSAISSPITVLTNSGAEGAQFDIPQFQNKMNTGSFISSASTKVPVMLRTILNDLDTQHGEVAVLVSDMKYSPVGAAAPSVLLSQYSTDISRIFADFNKAACLICATSNFFNSQRQLVCNRSPYYYLILGNPENVAEMRNGISTLLEQQGRFVDNIESGFDYGMPKYSFGISNKCNQLEEEPTFVNYEEAEDGDTCKITLKIRLEDYRWIMANENCFRKSFKVKSLYGTEVRVKDIKIEEKNITGENHELKREALAKVELSICNLVTDSDVIEWELDIPHTNYSLLSEFFDGAVTENDPSKSYSLLDFVNGIFHGGIVSKDLKSSYILISKNE